MDAREFIQQSLSTGAAIDGAKIFPSLLIDSSHKETSLCPADQALEYYQSKGFFGARSTRNEHGYGKVIRSLNSAPPWVESISMEEMNEITDERNFQLRPLARYVQETSDEAALERFLQYLSKRYETLHRLLEQSGSPVFDASLLGQLRTNEFDDFKNLIALARQLGPTLAYDLEQILLYEFGDDSSGFLVGTGAPDLLLWTQNGENEFWFFSEVKAPGDYLSATQKSWLARHWEVVQGHFLLTILA
jgi:hypothetical protein